MCKNIEKCIAEKDEVEGSSLESERVLAEDTVALEEISWEENEDGSITICKYGGNAQKLKIPEMIEGKQGIAADVGCIGNLAFSGCTSLVQIELPDSVKSIGDGAFSGCSKLEEIVVNQDNLSYETDDMGVLYNKGKTTLICCPARKAEVNIPSSVSIIEEYAFYGCERLEKIELPASVESIGDSAFCGCTSLTQMELPGSVREIGFFAFEGCESLVRIGISASVEYIGKGAFGRCSHLEKITVGQSNPFYETDDAGVLYNKGKTDLICCPAGKIEINILSGVSVIEDYAFCGCTSLVRIVLPGGVEIIGEDAFSGCTSLVQIELPGNVRIIGSSAFSGCTSLVKIEIPRSVEIMKYFVFCDCSKLEEIVVDQDNPSYETDDAGVLYSKGKTALICCPAGKTEIRIPMDVSFIEYGAFEGCESLKDVYYAGSREQWDAIDVDVFERDLLELAVIHYGHKSL